jgi:Na+/H+ antiporter NhaD/arsenite permease-like protein
MNDAAYERPIHGRILAVIVTALVFYGLATAAGWTVADAGHYAAEMPHQGEGQQAVKADEALDPAHPWAVIPFATLLGAIALLPLMEQTSHWWERNLNKFYVAGNLALVTLVYLAVFHPNAGVGRAAETLRHVIVADYVPFIVLLFTLYTISGGIRIEGDLPAHPLTNTLFIAIGGALASVIGTTGAAMLLVRPLLDTNAERKHVAHTVVFFIFVACNCGGLLSPLGDPPLFLGYLNGVDFLWTLSLWKSWLLVNGLLLAMYFALDRYYHYPRETRVDIVADETRVQRLKFSGIWPNSVLLVGVVLSVAFLDPAKAIPGTDWHPWLYLREMVQLALVGISLAVGSHEVRDANRFDYVAIVEVAALFIGIFIAMQPALELLHARGASLGIDTPQKFFWASGWLSSVLDNAPTYLVFFQTAEALPAGDQATVAGVAEPLLRAISLGSVMMGAMTYIGNGPNFMVKAIAEKAGVRMPSFFGYMAYSFLALLPVLVVNAWLVLD